MSTETLTILLFAIPPFQPTFWIFLARGVVLACRQTFFWHDASYPPEPLRRILLPKFDQSKSGMIPVMRYIQRDMWITASPKELNKWLYGFFCHNVHSGLNMRYQWILPELYTQIAIQRVYWFIRCIDKQGLHPASCGCFEGRSNMVAMFYGAAIWLQKEYQIVIKGK